MKLIFALLLCGMSCVLASPSCDEQEAFQCGKGSGLNEDNIYPDDAETLDKICPVVKEAFDCMIEFSKRCPNTLTGVFIASYEDSRATFQSLCDRDSDLRAKYFRNISCLKGVYKDLERKCESEIEEREYCKRNEDILVCIRNGAVSTCGEETGELLDEYFKSKRDMFKVFCMKEPEQ